MPYKCCDCGNVFEYPDVWQESRGEYWGVSCSESVGGCPNCHGDYEEAMPCKICGSHKFEDELNGEVCDKCLDEYKHDIEMCFKVGANETDKVDLNYFLASMFEKEEIEQILLENLRKKEKHQRVDCQEFIDSDRSWFAERLVEELGKEKK